MGAPPIEDDPVTLETQFFDTPVTVTLSSKTEEAMIREIREMALEDITRDIDKVATDIASVGNTVKQFKGGVASIGSADLVGPAVGLAINMLKKTRHK